MNAAMNKIGQHWTGTGSGKGMARAARFLPATGRFAVAACIAALAAALMAAVAQPVQAQTANTAKPRLSAAKPRPSAAVAPKPVVPDDPFSTLFRGPKFTTTPADPPDWVKQSRPGEEQPFIPTGRARPEPPNRAMSPDRVRQIERELDALRARHDQIGGRKPAKVAAGSVAGSGKGGKGKKKKTAKPCVLTCASTIGNIRRR